jgi:CDP-4-dehydro-6-deoxyglucose reductase
VLVKTGRAEAIYRLSGVRQPAKKHRHDALRKIDITMQEITLSSGRSFKAEARTSILDAAAQENVLIPYSCKTGRCNSCKCRVISGSTHILHAESGLTAAEKEQGWILSCARSAETDLQLEVEDLGITLPTPKTYPCRVSSVERVAEDVIRVRLRLPPTAAFSFLPGQYVDIIGEGGIVRSYSIANADFAEKMLELHIREVPDGAMSRYWFSQAKPNDLLRMKGPLGTFFLRDAVETDLFFLATGTGIAPVKAILESFANIAADKHPQSVTVLWGARKQGDLYVDIRGIPGKHLFIPVLSRPAKGWNGAKGHVQDVLLSMQPRLQRAAVYACGSTAMIEGAKQALLAAGLPANRFYSDAFVCSDAVHN